MKSKTQHVVVASIIIYTQKKMVTKMSPLPHSGAKRKTSSLVTAKYPKYSSQLWYISIILNNAKAYSRGTWNFTLPPLHTYAYVCRITESPETNETGREGATSIIPILLIGKNQGSLYKNLWKEQKVTIF